MCEPLRSSKSPSMRRSRRRCPLLPSAFPRPLAGVTNRRADLGLAAAKILGARCKARGGHSALEDRDQCQAFAGRPGLVPRRHPVEPARPSARCRHRLNRSSCSNAGSFERRTLRTIFREIASSRQIGLDRLALNETRPTDLRDRLRHKHRKPGLRSSRRHGERLCQRDPVWTPIPPLKRGPCSTPIHALAVTPKRASTR